jgi:2-keto-3-deoxy-L-rhamnonate aldolase RhmA
MRAAFDLGPQLADRSLAGVALGTFIIELPCMAAIRAVGLAGFDFVVIDMEHSTIGFGAIEPLVAAAQSFGLAALVRVWGEDVGLIGKALEAGANGLLIPHVGSVQRAREVVRQTRFPPVGQRSFSPLTRWDAVSQSKAEISARTIVIVQIEGADGLAAAAEIAAIPGIDGIFLGPHDLCMALDIAIGDPALRRVATELAGRLPQSSVKGVYVDRPEVSRMWRDLGFGLQCVGFDARMLADAAAAAFSIASRQVEKAA